MKEMDEQLLFAAAVGAIPDPEKLYKLAIPNGSGVGAYADCEELWIGKFDDFGLTEALLERWKRKSIRFGVCLFVSEGRLVGGRIFKYKDTSGDGHSTGYLMSPTRQELRLTGRLLKYLTE